MKGIQQKRNENPKLKQRLMADGRMSLFLEFYVGYDHDDEDASKVKVKRQRESLGLYYDPNPRTPIERNEVKEILALAEGIRREREQELLMLGEGFRLKPKSSVDLLTFIDKYLAKYCKRDLRQVSYAVRRFRQFLKEEKGYDLSNGFSLKNFDRQLILDFVEHLKQTGVGEGPKTIFNRFKKVIKKAFESGVVQQNPCQGIYITSDTQTLKKDVLSWDEVLKLIACHYQGENPEIRKAFILSLYCGLRFCDVKTLTYANIDYGNHLLKFDQSKTKGHSSASGVTTFLSDDLINMIGKPNDGDRNGLVFALPSHTMCLKALRHWVKRAQIEKHITWHCARHSFAVNILNNGANIKTLASLLGHSTIKYTEVYTRAMDNLKKEAMASLALPENLS